jgi:hypothetical protein
MGIRGTEPYPGAWARGPEQWQGGEPSEDDLSSLLEDALHLIEEGQAIYAMGMLRNEAVQEHYAGLERSVKDEVLRMVLGDILLEATLANLEMRLGLACSLVGSFLFEEALKYRHERPARRRQK